MPPCTVRMSHTCPPAKAANNKITLALRIQIALARSLCCYSRTHESVSHVPIISARWTYSKAPQTIHSTAANMHARMDMYPRTKNNYAYFVCTYYIFSKSMNGHACASLVSGGARMRDSRALIALRVRRPVVIAIINQVARRVHGCVPLRQLVIRHCT